MRDRLTLYARHLRDALASGDQDAAQHAATNIVKLNRRMRRDGR